MTEAIRGGSQTLPYGKIVPNSGFVGGTQPCAHKGKNR
jgi:hypothetical protein